MLTEIIRWSTIANTPARSGNDALFQLQVEQIGTFLFNAQANTITRFDNSAFLRLQNNPTIDASLLNSNGDIVTRSAQHRNAGRTGLTLNWRAYIGLLPYGTRIATAIGILTSVSRRDSMTSNTQFFSDTVGEQNRIFGGTNTNRGGRVVADGGYLRNVGHRIGLELRVVRPRDRTVTGTQQIGAVYRFEVRTRNSLALWNTVITTVSHSRTVSYSW